MVDRRFRRSPKGVNSILINNYCHSILNDTSGQLRLIYETKPIRSNHRLDQSDQSLEARIDSQF